MYNLVLRYICSLKKYYDICILLTAIETLKKKSVYFEVILFYWCIKNAVQANVENLVCHFKSIVIYRTKQVKHCSG